MGGAVTERVERVLRVATPIAALATVALALRFGAPSPTRSAIVTAAPASSADTGLAWQVLVVDENHSTREPLALAPVRAVAREGDEERVWSGATNEDGIAEMGLGFRRPEGMHLEITSGSLLLASGDVTVPAALPRARPETPWARFARREGAVFLEVAVLGQRAASGFPATVWVRASDAATRAPLAGLTIEPEGDSSFVPRDLRSTTDARGWAKIVATPWGHAVSMILHAHGPDGRKGDWAGALYVSPGAAELTVPDRVGPDEAPVIEVVTQTTRPTAYVEVDDRHGRAWGGAAPFVARQGAAPRAIARPSKLAPGLYWAIAADDPGGASQLGPGTSVRPFFVAASDEAALAFGTESETCLAPGGVHDVGRVVSVCLALASASPTPRWIALEGISRHATQDAARRSLGLAIALIAILVAAALEAVLIARAAVRARAHLRAAAEAEHSDAPVVERGVGALVAVLVAMLGFALFAAFVARMR
jgi:hypothetical protein